MNLKIAIASGKGGTGKTTIAVNLARIIPEITMLADCDVEEPNCHIFLKPEIDDISPVNLLIPEVDNSKCDACGECAKLCQFSAIISLPTETLVFPDLCHGCGGCAKVCPTGAITEVDHKVGVLEIGRDKKVKFLQGRLDVGAAMSPPVIRSVKNAAEPDGVVLIDCPPGTSCPVITAVRGCDLIVLVTEPTPFGLNDLILAVETAREIGIPFGVVINRADTGNSAVTDYCGSEHIPVLAEIPDNRRIAEVYSVGRVFTEVLPEYKTLFEHLYENIKKTVPDAGGETGRIDNN